MKDTETPTKVETKSIKHTFTTDERNNIGGDLARAIANMRNTEAEFEQVKAGYKARTTECEARIDNLSTSLMNGFEMRNEKCVVVFRPKDRKKDYYLESEFTEKNGESVLLLTEDMNSDDFAQELIQAESKFDDREEIPLFATAGSDYGSLIVGRFSGKWFSALRVKIGRWELAERLDSEQKCFKHRPDAVKTAVKRVQAWAKDHLKDHAKGFDDSFQSVIEAHKESGIVP